MSLRINKDGEHQRNQGKHMGRHAGTGERCRERAISLPAGALKEVTRAGRRGMALGRLNAKQS